MEISWHVFRKKPEKCKILKHQTFNGNSGGNIPFEKMFENLGITFQECLPVQEFQKMLFRSSRMMSGYSNQNFWSNGKRPSAIINCVG